MKVTDPSLTANVRGEPRAVSKLVLNRSLPSWSLQSFTTGRVPLVSLPVPLAVNLIELTTAPWFPLVSARFNSRTG